MKTDKYEARVTIYLHRAAKARRKAGRARLAEAEAHAANHLLAETNFKQEAEHYERLAATYHETALTASRKDYAAQKAREEAEVGKGAD